MKAKPKGKHAPSQLSHSAIVLIGFNEEFRDDAHNIWDVESDSNWEAGIKFPVRKAIGFSLTFE